jgi:ABC-2 type transport system ATP-binding protein
MTDKKPKNVIEITNLSRKFRRKQALDDITLSVPAGCVFGLLGENGAGKSTLIKHILGSLKTKQGTTRVFGLDPVASPEAVLSKIGYLSEDREMPTWMRVHEMMRYTQAFYPKWDETFADELLNAFRLDRNARIKTLSRGEKAQAGLLAALAHRPELLLLDEPSSGLDAIVRRDILGAIVRTVADEGRTVFFSSHLLDEVERVSDYIALMSGGKLILCDSMDNIKDSHHRLIVHFDASGETKPDINGALYCSGQGKEWTVICNGELEQAKQHIQKLGARVVEQTVPTLEEIFIAHSERTPHE